MTSPENATARKYPEPTLEGVAFGTAISQIHILPFIQPPLTLAVARGLSHVPAEVMAEIALGAFATSLLLTYLYEFDTLKKLGFTSNPFTTLAFMKVRQPYLATAIGDLIGNLVHSVNPIDLYYASASLTNLDGGHLFYANLVSRSVLLFLFNSGFNFALRRGHAEKIVAQIHNARQQLIDKFNQIELGLFPLNENLIDYPDNTSGDFHAWQPKSPQLPRHYP